MCINLLFNHSSTDLHHLSSSFRTHFCSLDRWSSVTGRSTGFRRGSDSFESSQLCLCRLLAFVSGKATSPATSWRWPTGSCCRGSVSSPTCSSLRVCSNYPRAARSAGERPPSGKTWAHTSSFVSAGVKKGDRVSIYMPMVVELVVAMLACARIGAVHSIVVSLWLVVRFNQKYHGIDNGLLTATVAAS